MTVACRIYFKVSLVAEQDVTWTEHLTYNTDCGFMQLEGNGDSALLIRTTRPQPAVARRQRDGSIALRFRRGGQTLPVRGTLARHGESHATGQTTDKCPKPGQPVASDCGVRPFGGHSTIGVGYYAQEDWPYDSDTPPLNDAIALTGPSVPGWRGGFKVGGRANAPLTPLRWAAR